MTSHINLDDQVAVHNHQAAIRYVDEHDLSSSGRYEDKGSVVKRVYIPSNEELGYGFDTTSTTYEKLEYGSGLLPTREELEYGKETWQKSKPPQMERKRVSLESVVSYGSSCAESDEGDYSFNNENSSVDYDDSSVDYDDNSVDYESISINIDDISVDLDDSSIDYNDSPEECSQVDDMIGFFGCFGGKDGGSQTLERVCVEYHGLIPEQSSRMPTRVNVQYGPEFNCSGTKQLPRRVSMEFMQRSESALGSSARRGSLGLSLGTSRLPRRRNMNQSDSGLRGPTRRTTMNHINSTSSNSRPTQRITMDFSQRSSSRSSRSTRRNKRLARTSSAPSLTWRPTRRSSVDLNKSNAPPHPRTDMSTH